MRLRRSLISCLLCAACGTSGSSSSSDESSGGEAPQPEVVAVTLPPAEIETVPNETMPNDPTTLDALGAAMAAAQNAGDPLCQQAYDGAMAMVSALSELGNGSPHANIPSEESFLEGCNTLPEQAQQCMTMSYAMANQETCSAVMQSPEVQAFRDQMRP